MTNTEGISNAPIIRFDQVTVTAHRKTILFGINFTLFPGEKAVLCGKSGSGKSSILRTLLGLHVVKQGIVYFQEKPLSPVSAQKIRNSASYIEQEPIMGAVNVRDALLLPFQFKAHREHRPTEIQLATVLQRLQLPYNILNQSCSRISGGEKQRIALARGLLLEKEVYLLDEVTSALDTENKQVVFDIFSDPHLTVLSVTHDPEWLERSTLVFELEAGRLTQVRKNGNP